MFILVLLYGYFWFNLKRSLVRLGSLPDGVHALAIALERSDLQAQLLAQMAADETSHAVRLPAGSGHGVHEQMHLRRAVRPYVSA